MNETILTPLKKIILAIMVAVITIFSYLPLAQPPMALIIVVLLLGWTISFILDHHYALADIPVLFLLMGVFALGKAFSILYLGGESFPLYVTEIAIALSLGLLLFREKSPLKLWASWTAMLPKNLAYVLPIYMVVGTLYLAFGFKANGAIALRDIVICHYAILLFITLSLLSGRARIQRLLYFMIPAITIVMWANFRIHYFYKPRISGFRQFIAISKATNFTLYFGLIFIFGLCLLPLLGKKMKWVTRFLLFFSLLFVIVWESRTAWVGLLVALIFLAFLLKKDFLIALLLIILMVPTLLAIDYFHLGARHNKISNLGEGIAAMGNISEPSTKGANIRFRLNLWNETWAKIRQRPLLGWGFGLQIDYLIWKKRLSTLKAMGLSTGIMPAHNHVLAITHKMGFIGLALFLFINFRIFFLGLFYLKHCKSEFLRRLLVGGLAGLLYWHGMAFFFDILESPPTGIFLWMILGLILAVIHADKKNTLGAVS